ncbi:hypothetical protein ACVWZW_007331 [Bradyrhizobium sp. F1.13.4]
MAEASTGRRPQHLKPGHDEIGRADQLQDRERGRRSHQQGRKADRGARDVEKAAATDAQRRRGATSPAQLHAAADHIDRIWPRRDVEQHARQDEKPDFVNAQHV